MNLTSRILTAILAVGLTACQPSGTTNKSADGQQREVSASEEKTKTTENRNIGQNGATKQKERKTTTMNVKELTTADFKRLVMNYELHPKEWIFEGDKPALIDFYATWCGPCKATAPIVEEMAEKYNGKIDVYKVDVDQQEELAAVFGIRSIPTLLFIPKDGNPQMQVGAMSRSQMDEAIQKVLL
ncbi:MAG: thioredoxin [Prevotella sp.]|jgi:thioredoxin 1